MKAPEQTPLDLLVHKTHSHISVIWGYVQLVQNSLDKDSEEYEWLSKVTEECHLIKENIDKLKAMATSKE